ncbi:MAG: hypothetical protein IJS29_04830 [Selenomonadaceae bacterium]|nr:hypothetical protein [Selenomonadaceae bacterium]
MKNLHDMTLAELQVCIKEIPLRIKEIEKTLEDLTGRKSQLSEKLSDLEKKSLTESKSARANGATVNEILAIIDASKDLNADLNAEMCKLNSEIATLEKELKEKNGNLKMAKHLKTQLLNQQAEEKAKCDNQVCDKKSLKDAESTSKNTESTKDIESASKEKIARNAEKILNTLKVQVIPSFECVEPNDAFIKLLFNLNDDDFKSFVDGQRRGKITEKKSHKHKGRKGEITSITSSYSIQNAKDYENDMPLDEFDRAVLGVVISEYLAGNKYTTVNIIFRALIGKVGQAGIMIRKNQRDAIIKALKNLRGRIVDFSGLNQSLAEMKYTDKDGNKLTLRESNLISAEIVDAEINGQEVQDVIFFKENSPLFDIADAKSQVIRYPHELLNVPYMNNTPLIITMKKYIIRRICEIKLHKQLYPTITFNDVFKKCRVENTTNREIIRRRREYIVKFFEHLKKQEFINDFEVLKRGNSFHGVKFSY